MITTAMHETIIGQFRMFGEHGPVYRVVKTLREAPDGAALMEVEVVDSGERLECLLQDILSDPEAK